MEKLIERVSDLCEALRIEWHQRHRENIIADYEKALVDSAEYQEASYSQQCSAEIALRNYAEGIGAY